MVGTFGVVGFELEPVLGVLGGLGVPGLEEAEDAAAALGVGGLGIVSLGVAGLLGANFGVDALGVCGLEEDLGVRVFSSSVFTFTASGGHFSGGGGVAFVEPAPCCCFSTAFCCLSEADLLAVSGEGEPAAGEEGSLFTDAKRPFSDR